MPSRINEKPSHTKPRCPTLAVLGDTILWTKEKFLIDSELDVQSGSRPGSLAILNHERIQRFTGSMGQSRNVTVRHCAIGIP